MLFWRNIYAHDSAKVLVHDHKRYVFGMMASAMKIATLAHIGAVSLSCMVLGATADAAALIQPSGIDLAPHRAIYELKLDRANSGSNVASLTGFLVIEFTGSACEGYVQNTKLLTKSTDWTGEETVTDMRSSNWESGRGESFRFNSVRYFNDVLSETIEGSAKRETSRGSITLTFKKPAAGTAKIPGDSLFPTQHIIAILKSAMEGKFVLQANIFDGLEKDEKIYETNTVIGKAVAPGSGAALPPVANAEVLSDLVSWPVSISYFEPGKSQDATPSYEIAYRLYSNGVSRKLHIDYGSFSIEGDLRMIEFLKANPCPKGPNKPVRR